MSVQKSGSIERTAMVSGAPRNIHAPTPSAWAAPVLWLTGLSGAGKSTLATATSRLLDLRGIRTIVIDGDALRSGLSSDLGFSAEDRAESVRRASEVAALCSRAGITAFVALVSPFEADRSRARAAIGSHFHEVFVNTDFKTCRARDPKGLYRLAEEGKIKNFTGLDSPYEAPKHPELVIDTMAHEQEACILQLASYTMNVCLSIPFQNLPAAHA